MFVSAAFNAQAETWFDPAFFKDDPSMVADLSRFEKGQKITPGVYRVDIVLNQTIVDTRNVNFVEITPEKGIAACLTTETLDAMGVNTDAFPAFKQLDKQACVPLAEIIPDASVTFNVNKLRLEISVPQIAIKSNARGYVPPERWDEGINALLLGYSFSGANSIHSSADSDSGDSYFLNLNSGVNLGPWRLRNNSTWSRSSGQTAEWKNLSSYLQRAVIPLKGELTVGDDYTAGDFFDSVSFRGVQLASDDNMLPDSLKGFAPVVRGIAKSNAQITIKQNGYTIYQTYVSPGAFEISDLYSTSSSGDLLVEIKEADGSVNSYSVPFSSVPLLQHQGRIKYAVTLAKYKPIVMNSRRANLPRPRCSGADRGERHGMVVDNMLNITVPPCLVWDLTLAISEQFRSMRPRRRVRWQTKANIKVSHIVFCMPKRSTNWALIFN